MFFLNNVEGRVSLRCKVDSYQSTDAPSIDRCNVIIEVKQGEEFFESTFPALTTIDFVVIYEWFKCLHNRRLPEFACLSFIEPCLEFKYLASRREKIRFSIKLSHEFKPDFALKQFGFNADGSPVTSNKWSIVFELGNEELLELLTALESTIMVYPIRIRNSKINQHKFIPLSRYQKSSALPTYSSTDAYEKLRPWTAIEQCKCDIVHSLILVDLLTDNPIHCGTCRKEVDPERIELTIKETELVARWFSASHSLYMLWLHSGEYENYAKEQLTDPNGQINRDGLMVASILSAKYPTRLWLFHDTDDGEPKYCPICKHPLNLDISWGNGGCSRCNIVI